MRIFITGSADGLGNLAAQRLITAEHSVVLHARSESRAHDAMEQAPGAEAALVADLSDLEQVRALAEQVNSLGEFDAVIHNAGIYSAPSEQMFAVNSLAPYVLTALIQRPKRLIYLSSGMHKSGSLTLEGVDTIERNTTYGDSKLQVLVLTKAVARRWPDVYANAVDPGWVPTKMGGEGAPGNLEDGVATQVWLATSDNSNATVSGQYFYLQQQAEYQKTVDDTALQDAFIARCAAISGVTLPG